MPVPVLGRAKRRPPQKPAETRTSTSGENATAGVQPKTASDAPGPSRAEAHPHGRAVSASASSHPTTANPSRLAAIRRFPCDETNRKDRELPRGRRQPEKEELVPPGQLRPASWPSASCCSSFSSPSARAWSSGTRSPSTPRTPRRKRSTPSSPERADGGLLRGAGGDGGLYRERHRHRGEILRQTPHRRRRAEPTRWR